MNGCISLDIVLISTENVCMASARIVLISANHDTNLRHKQM